MNRGVKTTGGLLAIVLAIALAGPLISPHEYQQTNFDALLQPPSLDDLRLFGTDDLGQLILKSLSDAQGVGNGLVLGLCVAFIGLAIDQVLRTWANQRKQALGLN